MFTTNYQEILAKIDQIDPVKYGKTRNFTNGAVTHLSPYISRGIISTKQVFHHVIAKGYDFWKIEKFIQELAWRDYWQQIWIEKGDLINNDLKSNQTEVSNFEFPEAILEANTGISAIDTAITNFYKTGYLHNHVRMYIASIACNIGKSHWKIPAKWMYYHLLDADWASNALSWQWVAGTNSNKKYFANQDNINKFCNTTQKGTFLDVSYSEFADLEIPICLSKTVPVVLKTILPVQKKISIDPKCPTLIYNFYNLDPIWRNEINANRILLLEPSVFKEYPISKKTIDFILQCGKNITNLQVFVGEFNELKATYSHKEIYFKEHPLNQYYEGIQDARDWMFEVKGYFPSFFAFWKRCKKELKLWRSNG